MEKNGILKEFTGNFRNRIFGFAPYLNLFNDWRVEKVLKRSTIPSLPISEQHSNSTRVLESHLPPRVEKVLLVW